MRVSLMVGMLVLAAAAAANAGIIGTPWMTADGDGAVDTQQSVWTATSSTEGTLSVVEQMYRTPAHILGAVQADGDPIVWVLKSIENASGSNWTGYHFNIFMDQSFTILASSQPLGWTAVVTPASAGAYVDADGRSWGYWGAVDYTSTAAANDIAIGGSGDFGAKLKFDTGVQFEVEQMYVVPEPMSLALLALGGLLVRRVRK